MQILLEDYLGHFQENLEAYNQCRVDGKLWDKIGKKGHSILHNEWPHQPLNQSSVLESIVCRELDGELIGGRISDEDISAR
jgi:hypothetical protein